MAHYAYLNDQNIVTDVIVGKNDDLELQYSNFRGQPCKRTSFNTIGGIHYTNNEPSEDQSKSFRKNYAGIGYTYDESRDAFIPAKPFNSWILNETTCLWEAPVEYPDDGQPYYWNEETQTWDLITE